jgi:hypothetical protein
MYIRVTGYAETPKLRLKDALSGMIQNAIHPKPCRVILRREYAQVFFKQALDAIQAIQRGGHVLGKPLVFHARASNCNVDVEVHNNLRTELLAYIVTTNCYECLTTPIKSASATFVCVKFYAGKDASQFLKFCRERFPNSYSSFALELERKTELEIVVPPGVISPPFPLVHTKTVSYCRMGKMFLSYENPDNALVVLLMIRHDPAFSKIRIRPI